VSIWVGTEAAKATQQQTTTQNARKTSTRLDKKHCQHARKRSHNAHRKARTETGRQTSKQKAPAPRLQNCMNSQEIKIKTAQIKRFLRF